MSEDLARIPVDPDDLPARPVAAEQSFAAVLERRLSRRTWIGTALAAAAAAACRPLRPKDSTATAAPSASTLDFRSIANRIDDDHRVAPGYSADVLIRWGDPVLAVDGAFDPTTLDAEAQAQRFGYNNDYIAFLPLPAGSQNSDHGLLCVNHEYTISRLMWRDGSAAGLSRAQVQTEIAAHGQSVVEVRRGDDGWRTIEGGRYARRITAATPMRVAGPAAGHPRMRTAEDPEGTTVLGTLSNCAGGTTPWGTVLTAEENFQSYFAGDASGTSEARNHKRYGVPFPFFGWSRYEARFRSDVEPHEPNRFGWLVEIDPYDPESRPVKRTALGRCKHEGAAIAVSHDDRVAVYSGDDQQFEYVYRFVSKGRIDRGGGRSANGALLDEGTLYAARFDDDGSGTWLPLVHGEGPLTAANGFASQADVCIEARRAADLLGATPMDRPEDVELDPRSGRLYVALTNNTARTPAQVDAANPRAANRFGQVVVLEAPPAERAGNAPDDGATVRDHTATTFHWDTLLRGGNPKVAADGASYHPEVGDDDWLSSPDNAAVDPRGRLWIATDQGYNQETEGIPDGIRACDTEGDGRALTRLFYAVPRGAEAAGPAFTPDGSTLFVSVQHPGDTTTASYDKPGTRWPDFDPEMPPRPSVVAITRKGGGAIGG